MNAEGGAASNAEAGASPPGDGSVAIGSGAGVEGALALAYRYVARRERTVHEIRDHLARRGVEAALAEQAIAALREDGYVDDARFARVFTSDKRELDGWGSERISRALRDRGVDAELIDAAVAGGGHAEELGRALGVLRRRFPVPPVVADPRERERALAVLLRKGYDSELAVDALNRHTRDG